MEDLSAHTRERALELLTDIELSQTSITQQVLKASRLARLIGDDDAITWLQFELSGVPGTASGRDHMTRTERWTDESENKGFWASTTADLESRVYSLQENLAASRVESFSGDSIVLASRNQREYQISISTAIGEATRVLNRVRSLLHEFARRTYYELEFSAEQQSLFQSTRNEIDGMLAPQVGESLDKIDSIYRRLGESDAEAISQAMNTVRRLINSFADSVYPAVSDGTVDLGGGNVIKIGEPHHQNRIIAYVADQTDSTTRRKRLRQSLANIYDRSSAGSHAEVTTTEARYLFLSTYVLLGEILTLSK